MYLHSPAKQLVEGGKPTSMLRACAEDEADPAPHSWSWFLGLQGRGDMFAVPCLLQNHRGLDVEAPPSPLESCLGKMGGEKWIGLIDWWPESRPAHTELPFFFREDQTCRWIEARLVLEYDLGKPGSKHQSAVMPLGVSLGLTCLSGLLDG